MRNTIVILSLLALTTTAFPLVAASIECGGVESNGLFVDDCQGFSSSSGCSSYCYSYSSQYRCVTAAYVSGGGTLGASACTSNGESCYSSTTYDCYRGSSVGAGAYMDTFVPFVGQESMYPYASLYGWREEGSNGSSCGWGLYTPDSYTPISNDCTITMPPLP